ncbi:Hypothetical predicted protein, partial [Pelobates cultripes]
MTGSTAGSMLPLQLRQKRGRGQEPHNKGTENTHREHRKDKDTERKRDRKEPGGTAQKTDTQRKQNRKEQIKRDRLTALPIKWLPCNGAQPLYTFYPPNTPLRHPLYQSLLPCSVPSSAYASPWGCRVDIYATLAKNTIYKKKK